MVQLDRKVKETTNKLKQVESLVYDLYMGNMGLITKERVCMVSAAIEALISIETEAKNQSKLKEQF